jgi:hypothetical protein
MSIDGCVLCTCLDNGTALPPPCPIVVEGEWVHPAEGHADRWRAVREWAETACPHPQFRLVDGRVVRSAVRGALDDHGGVDVFPALLSALPTLNGGRVSPRRAADCVVELDHLADLMRRIATMVVLVDDADGEIVRVYDDEHYTGGDEPIGLPPTEPGVPTVVSFDDRYGATMQPAPDRPWTVTWLGRDTEVRVRDAGSGEILFSATSFTQYADGDDWMFHDDRTGARVRHRSPVIAQPTRFRFRTDIRPVDIDVYLTGVAFLRTLFATSARTGRPVHWY